MKRVSQDIVVQQGDAKFHYRAKKSLGQHFLRSKHAIQKIIEASLITPGEIVIEVGPGEGVLTEALLNAGARVIAIEKDRRCIEALGERFADALRDEHLLLIEGDVLSKKILDELYDGILAEIPNYKVVANIPYYITGALFRLFLEHEHQPTLITFLVQKEVGEQIVARNGKEGILSLSIKVFGDPRYVAKVSREAFSPKPKVDSAIVTVSNISRSRLRGMAQEDFFKIMKVGFRARRKMLAGNLVTGLHLKKESVLDCLTSLGLDEKIRGEDLDIARWIALAEKLPK